MAENHDRLTAKAAEAKIPITGAFELSPLCNFACRMCYVRQDTAQVQAAGGLKPLSFWMDQAKQAFDAGCLFPLLTGGEPFLYPHFRELYTFMHKSGMQVSINTNGSMIDEETVAWLKTMPPVRINITLYGGGRESYGRLCGNPGAFDRVLHACDLLTENRIRFRFNCSLTPENADDFDAMFDIAARYRKGLRMSTYMFPPVRRTGTSGDYEARLSPDQAAYYEVRMNYRQASRDRFRILAQNAMKYTEPTEEQLRTAAAGEPRKMGCLSGRCSFWVDWQGNLSGCGVNNYPRLSLSEHSFTEAWQKIVEHTRDFRYSPPCANCINRGICFSCAAMVYNETGDFFGRPTYLCEKAKASAKWYAKFLAMLPEDDSPLPAGEFIPTCPIEEF